MTDEEKWEIIQKAMENASMVLGVDHAYFGAEGDLEVARQLKMMGYNAEDFIN